MWSLTIIYYGYSHTHSSDVHSPHLSDINIMTYLLMIDLRDREREGERKTERDRKKEGRREEERMRWSEREEEKERGREGKKKEKKRELLFVHFVYMCTLIFCQKTTCTLTSSIKTQNYTCIQELNPTH